MTADGATWGAYGKMPALGDFFRIRVDAGFTQGWDLWLQEELLAFRGRLGPEAYEAAYMSAPLWRFALAPGVCGPSRVTGVLMPSLDRVGRHFPLTLVAALQPAPGRGAASTLIAQGDALEAAEALAIAMLGEEGAAREDLDRGLATLGLAPDLSQGRVWAGPILWGGQPDQLAADLVGGFVPPQQNESFWAATAGGRTRAFACEGLPRGGLFSALFDLQSAFWSRLSQ